MKVQTLLLSLFALPAFAETTPLSEMSVLQMIAPLFLVIILIFLLAWLVKKINPGQATLGKDITILSSTPVSGQARLCLVRVGSKDILVGVTNQQITHIETFNEPVIEQLSESGTNELSKQFSRLLKPKKPS